MIIVSSLGAVTASDWLIVLAGAGLSAGVTETYTNGETLNVPSMGNKGKVSTDNKIP